MWKSSSPKLKVLVGELGGRSVCVMFPGEIREYVR